jgi:heme/copper-type cytochrome/quinol oxidase subunit 1
MSAVLIALVVFAAAAAIYYLFPETTSSAFETWQVIAKAGWGLVFFFAGLALLGTGVPGLMLSGAFILFVISLSLILKRPDQTIAEYLGDLL